MKHWLPFLFLLLIAVSCKKDSTLNPFDDCKSFDNKIDRDGCDFGVSLKTASPYHQKPCFNPNNADEFAYRKGSAIYKYTISSGVETLIKYDVRPLTQLDWGAKGWITFTNSDWNVWVLKDDGSELKQLTNNPRDWGPEFNSKGDQLVFGRGMTGTVEPRELYKMMILNLAGNPIDSFCRPVESDICYPWEFCAWSSDDQLVAEFGPNNSGTVYGIALYDFEGLVKEMVHEVKSTSSNDDFIQDVEWHPNNSEVFFTDGYGLKRVDVQSKKVKTIKKSCDSLTYFDISISSDGKTILASRETSTYEDCTVTSYMELVLMDIDGKNERVVETDRL